ncbi:MAG: antibiotic biosynthesis monooxygenase [Lachnospiraceae bacterium]|nr:antibiotic biosynthesis monooxygenase [Lachnospiraceae bacterium]
MYIIHVTYEVKDGMRDAFLKKLKKLGTAECSRAEEGNLDYTYYISPDREDIVFLTEVWESMDAQKAHTQTSHFKALGEIKGEYVQNTVLKFFDGAVQIN